MKDFNTYLFDFDGTLIDSHDSLVLVFKGAYKAVGVDVPTEFVLQLMRIPLFVGYELLKAPDDDASKRKFGDEIIRLLDAEEVLNVTKTFDEVKEVLLSLKRRGKTLGIVTSNNVKHVRQVLEYVDIDPDLFSVIIGNQEVRRHKPYPDPILKALEVLNISTEGVCYVGDGLDDMKSAVAAKVEPILIDRLDEYENEPYIYINTLDELL